MTRAPTSRHVPFAQAGRRRLPGALIVRLCCVGILCATNGEPVLAATCGANVSGPGNRSCSAPAERQVIRKMIEGAWEAGACGVRHPIGWRTRQERAGGPILILPNPKSFLAELTFRASVHARERAPTAEERERRAWLEKWEPSEDSGTSPDDFDAWVRAHKAATTQSAADAAAAAAEAAAAASASPDDMHFRYIGAVYEGLGEDTEEYDATAVIRREAQQGRWRVAHTIREFAGMYSEPDSPVHLTTYVCTASDRMSIEAFASVCTALWERMMMAEAAPGVCREPGDDD